MAGNHGWRLGSLSKDELSEFVHYTAGGQWQQGKVCQQTADRWFPDAPTPKEALQALNNIQSAAWNLVAAFVSIDAGTGGEGGYRSIAYALLENLPQWASYRKPAEGGGLEIVQLGQLEISI